MNKPFQGAGEILVDRRFEGDTDVYFGWSDKENTNAVLALRIQTENGDSWSVLAEEHIPAPKSQKDNLQRTELIRSFVWDTKL